MGAGKMVGWWVVRFRPGKAEADARKVGEKTMEYRGEVYWTEEELKGVEDLEEEEAGGEITKAILTQTKVSIDWEDSEGAFGLIAVSTDGCHYRGEYADNESKLLDSRFRRVGVDATPRRCRESP